MGYYVLKNCRFALAWINGELKILENIDVVIEGDRVVEACKSGECKSGTGYFDKIDCSSYILIPGLVNAHTHTPMSLLRGFYDDAELDAWLNRMWSVEKGLTPEIVRLGSELSIIEMLMSGTTAFVDMYFYPEETAEVAVKYGIRAALGPPFIDVLLEPVKAENDVRNFTARFKGHELIKPILNVHSVYAVSEDTLLRVKSIKEELGLDLHIHVSETRHEVFEVKKRKGVFPVEYLAKLGLLDEKVQLVHLGWVTNWELRLIKDAKAKVTHAPTSNMKLATAGHFPMRELIDMNVLVTLGTDGPASNNCLDMFREMKNAVLLQRHSYWNVDIKAYHAFKAATSNGYALFGLNGGCLDPGCIADFVLLDAHSPRLLPLRRDNLLSNIVYSANGSDTMLVIINGDVKFDRERDEARFRERALEIAKRLNEFITRYVE